MENDEIKLYEFDLLKKQTGINHGVFSRSGGTSQEPFDSLNIGMNSGDKESAIASNRKLIISEMGMKPLVFLNQVHGDTVKVIKEKKNNLTEIFEPGKEAYTADGVITDIKGVFLVIQVADCQSVMMYDPEKGVVANVHSGWRGSIKNILGQCVQRMVEEFNCTPGSMIAGISPSLGPCCSEFINYKEEIPEILWKYKLPDSVFFDFWQLSEDQLLEKGLKKENIENMRVCTKCNTDRFYSYRGEKTTGRFACVISMN